jgi:Tfp pilus assembly protein PilF
VRLSLLILTLGLFGAEPAGGLEAARAAVAAGDVSGAVRLLAQSSPEETAYAKALRAALAHEEQFRLAYHVAGKATDVSNAVLERLRKEPELKDAPELVAHATRLAAWQVELDGLRSRAKTAAERGELASARLLYERVRDHPLALGAAAAALRRDTEAALLEVSRRASAEAARRDELARKLHDGAPELLPLPHVAAEELGAVPPLGVDAVERRAKYEDALDELRRQDLLVRLAYQSGGRAAAEEVLKKLKASERLGPYPAMGAHAYRLERWVQQESLADWPQQLLEDTWAAGSSVLELALLAVLVLALGGLFRAVRKWRASRSKVADLRVFDLSDAAVPLGPSEAQALRLKLVFEEASAGDPLEVRGSYASLGEALPRWGALANKDLGGLEQYVSADQKLSIGPLSIPLRAVWLLLARAFAAPRYRWTVVIRPMKDSVCVSLSEFDVSKGERRSWTVVSAGGSAVAVDEAFRKLALKCLHDRKASRLFSSSDAFVAFHDGVRALAGGQLPEARRLLEEARRLDPTNLRTELVLATVLRRSGEVEGTEALLTEVSDRLAASRSSTSSTATQQELGDELRYQRALLDAQSHNTNRLYTAVSAFNALAKGRSPLAVHARACLIDAYVTLASDLEFTHDPVEHARLLRKAEELGRFFQSATRPEGFGLTEKDWNEARGYALHAEGKRHLHRQDFSTALKVLHSALLCSPELLPAYVAVARTARRAKGRVHNWEGVAERALGRALALNPDDPAVNYQLGRFHLERSAPQPDEAARHFTRAAPLWAAARYQLGLLKGREAPLEGLKLIGEAIRKSGRMPSYYAKGIRECLATELKSAASASPGGEPPPPGTSAAERLAQAMWGVQPPTKGWLKSASKHLRVEAQQVRMDPRMKKALEDFASALDPAPPAPAA